MRICLSQVWRIQLPNVSIIYLLWSQANCGFSTRGWIRPRHRAMASITGLSGSINHRITGACGVRSSSLLLSPYLPHPEGFVWLLFQPNPLLWYSHGKAWKCPEGQRDLDMLRSLFNGKAVPLKYPQQETAISHRHAKTAVTSLHQGDTWKELLPVVWALPCFILSLPLSGFSQCPPLWSPFKRPPSLCNSTHTAATYPLTLLTSGWLCDKQEHNRKPHNLTGSLRCKERFEIPFKLSALPLNLAVREQLLCVTCLRVSARGGDRRF